MPNHVESGNGNHLTYSNGEYWLNPDHYKSEKESIASIDQRLIEHLHPVTRKVYEFIIANPGIKSSMLEKQFGRCTNALAKLFSSGLIENDAVIRDDDKPYEAQLIPTQLSIF